MKSIAALVFTIITSRNFTFFVLCYGCLYMDINHFQALNVASLIPEANPAFCHIQYARAGGSGIFSHASDIRIERMVQRV